MPGKGTLVKFLYLINVYVYKCIDRIVQGQRLELSRKALVVAALLFKAFKRFLNELYYLKTCFLHISVVETVQSGFGVKQFIVATQISLMVLNGTSPTQMQQFRFLSYRSYTCLECLFVMLITVK